jgi:hypothetical protein
VEWIVAVWPNLGDIENIESIVSSIFLGHKLNLPSPCWEVLLDDRLEQI